MGRGWSIFLVFIGVGLWGVGRSVLPKGAHWSVHVLTVGVAGVIVGMAILISTIKYQKAQRICEQARKEGIQPPPEAAEWTKAKLWVTIAQPTTIVCLILLCCFSVDAAFIAIGVLILGAVLAIGGIFLFQWWNSRQIRRIIALSNG